MHAHLDRPRLLDPYAAQDSYAALDSYGLLDSYGPLDSYATSMDSDAALDSYNAALRGQRGRDSFGSLTPPTITPASFMIAGGETLYWGVGWGGHRTVGPGPRVPSLRGPRAPGLSALFPSCEGPLGPRFRLLRASEASCDF